MSSDQEIKAEVDKEVTSADQAIGGALSVPNASLARQFLLSGTAGVMASAAVMAQDIPDQNSQYLMDINTPHATTMMHQPSLMSIEAPQLSTVSWNDVAPAQNLNTPDDKLQGWERLNVVLTSGSRHIGARTYQVEETQTYDFGDILPDVPGLDFEDFVVDVKTVKDEPFNEFNPGFGVEYRLNDHFHAAAGLYSNSIHGLSVYAGAGVETNREKFLGAGLDVGAVTGYQDGVVPSAFPYIRLGREDHILNAQIGGFPEIENVTPAVIALRVRVNLEPTIDALSPNSGPQ